MLRGTRRFDPIRASARCSAVGRARGPMSARAHPRVRWRASQPARSLKSNATSDRSQTSPRWSARCWRMRHRMRVEPAAPGPIKHTCLTRVCFCANFSSKHIGMGRNSAETVEWFKTGCNSGDLSRTALAHELCVQGNWFGRVLLPRGVWRRTVGPATGGEWRHAAKGFRSCAPAASSRGGDAGTAGAAPASTGDAACGERPAGTGSTPGRRSSRASLGRRVQAARRPPGCRDASVCEEPGRCAPGFC